MGAGQGGGSCALQLCPRELFVLPSLHDIAWPPAADPAPSVSSAPAHQTEHLLLNAGIPARTAPEAPSGRTIGPNGFLFVVLVDPSATLLWGECGSFR